MNRTDRLYALVEELRAVSPRPRSARWLADRFEVSTRTIERDIGALQESGVPIWAEAGRTGGYALDRARTLPPVNLSPVEAVAMAVALHRMRGTPFAAAAGTALRKLLAVMPATDAAEAHRLAARVHLIGDGPVTPVPAAVADAVRARRLLRIRYADRAGAGSLRDVEPLGYLGNPRHWYLLAWCRLRDGIRAFRVDRITSVTTLAERVPERELAADDLDIPRERIRRLSLV
ncbi:WYL domain-containing protein [Micromonospora peucetia]|uniref:Predicted DNA-binding transcriptional regulator YafY, contains an HTH and WYL domains n=1 Tax=Micromonospora peucetia TaxID=47871 RepID=A0A1C6VN64_9ACTN|nr:WYL domain-containing protein [Micromonospora peucetia]MCX4388666.1 WYL domain-containing protein [Micromonospora peucetia]WSA30688.1 WYL domain-containing protein [Micromonospora peucetia]SCL67778.1 Predicted DNA-binding transcriptional regulator YafY, contains an HTH and WYL domains [Micromonospora peucetia]